MAYEKKLILLLTVIFCLLCLYIGTFFIGTEKSLRNSNISWLDMNFIHLADRIEIYGFYGRTILLRKNNIWVLREGSIDYPVRQNKVEELFRDLSRRKNYPLRSSTSDPGIFGLGEEASRIIIRAGTGIPLLDLLVGYNDVSGRDVFLRRAGQTAIRSGEDIFTIYTESDPSFWYDLRIFPDLSASMVQRVHIFPLFAEQSPFTLSRRNNGWINESSGALVPRAESWLRILINTQGENFINTENWESEGSMVLELGDGNVRLFRVSSPDLESSRMAVVSGAPVGGSDLVFVLSEWTIRRLWGFSFFPEDTTDNDFNIFQFAL